MLKSRSNPQDKIILSENVDVARAAADLGQGKRISAEMNERIKKLNKQLSPKAQLVSAESKAQIAGGKAEDYIEPAAACESEQKIIKRIKSWSIESNADAIDMVDSYPWHNEGIHHDDPALLAVWKKLKSGELQIGE